MLVSTTLRDGAVTPHSAALSRIGIATLPMEAAIPSASEPELRLLATPSGGAPSRWWRRRVSATRGRPRRRRAVRRRLRHGVPAGPRVVCSPATSSRLRRAAETGLITRRPGQLRAERIRAGGDRHRAQPGPRAPCGSLGYRGRCGFPRAIARRDTRTFAFPSDGELQEGHTVLGMFLALPSPVDRTYRPSRGNNSRSMARWTASPRSSRRVAKWQARLGRGRPGRARRRGDRRRAAGLPPGCSSPHLDPPRAGLPPPDAVRHHAARGPRREGGRAPASPRNRPTMLRSG
jgi:hypothetical protein